MFGFTSDQWYKIIIAIIAIIVPLGAAYWGVNKRNHKIKNINGNNNSINNGDNNDIKVGGKNDLQKK